MEGRCPTLQDKSTYRTTNKRAAPNLDTIQSSGPGTSISGTWIHLVVSWSDVTGRTPPPRRPLAMPAMLLPYGTANAAVSSRWGLPDLSAYPPAHQTTRGDPAYPGRGGIKLGSLAGAWLLFCLAMPPCRDLCNVGIGIDYGDCVVAAGPEGVSEPGPGLPPHHVPYCTAPLLYVPPYHSTTLFRNKLRGGRSGSYFWHA